MKKAEVIKNGNVNLEMIYVGSVQTEMQKKVNEFIARVAKEENEIFINALRTFAIPPIKGEITKGKVKWRGIRLCQQTTLDKTERWLEQRGVQISPKITINAAFTDQTY